MKTNSKKPGPISRLRFSYGHFPSCVMKKFALLLTACIMPTDATIQSTKLQRNNPLVRLEDYKNALRYWLAYPDDRIKAIVFVENSGYSLSELRELAATHNELGREIEFLQFPASPVPPGLHYGYQELEMIDNALTHSELLRKIDYVIKATGRLYFPALSRLLDTVKPGQLFVSDSRDFDFLNRSHHYVLTTLFIAQKQFYLKYLYKTKDTMVKATSLMEMLFYHILKPLYKASPEAIVLRFPFNVNPVGISATLNKSYVSKKQKLAFILRGACRILIPSLWI